MTESDNVKMEISIAGELLQLTVPFSRQEAVRNTEKAVNDLYSEWRKKFPRKSEKELMVMIAYQYASYYDDLRKRYDNAAYTARRADEALDKMLADSLPSSEKGTDRKSK